MPKVDPIGSASSYAGDVARAVRFGEVVKRGFAKDLVEASIRYVLSNPDLTTTLVGLSTLEQLDHAGQSANKGPLPGEALKLIASIQQGFVGRLGRCTPRKESMSEGKNALGTRSIKSIKQARLNAGAVL